MRANRLCLTENRIIASLVVPPFLYLKCCRFLDLFLRPYLFFKALLIAFTTSGSITLYPSAVG